MPENNQIKSIVLGGGCFWCTEAVFRQVSEVVDIVPGYAGGDVPNPTYERVASGQTGHAEVVKVDYRDAPGALEKILMIFFKTHDPTLVNRQGPDIGSQYRSIILWSDESQKRAVAEHLAKIKKDFKAPLATELKRLDEFYPAEVYHYNYYAKNQDNPYSQSVIAPKVAKAKKLNE